MADSQADWAHLDRTCGMQDLACALGAEIRVRGVAKGAAAPPEAAGLAPKPT